jgi:hypothetical protein
MPKKHRIFRIGSRAWKRFRGHHKQIDVAVVHAKPINSKAVHPNKPSPAIAHVAPTRKPGEGLTGAQARLHKVMVATVGNPFGWTYNFIRPLTLPKGKLTNADFASRAALNAALKRLVSRYRSDCSWGGKTLFWLVGCADDPTGEKWNGWGNTSTTYQHLPKRPGLDNAMHPAPADLARCQVGDIGLVGENGSDHFFIIMEAGPNPLVWSDGFNGAPNSYHVLDDPRRPISVCIPNL